MNAISTRLRHLSRRALAALLGAVAIITAGIGLRASGAFTAQAGGHDAVRTVAETVNQDASNTNGSDASDNAVTNQQGAQQPSTLTRLTPAEQSMCEQDPAKCYAAKASRDFAFANADTVAGVSTDKLNDKADAARHCLWQLHLTTWFDADYATAWGNVHEQSDDPQNTHAMDLHNNIVARSLAGDQTLRDLKNTSDTTIAADVAAQGSGTSPYDQSTIDAVNQRIIALCTTAVSHAVLATYTPPTGAALPDQLTPDPKDRLVYFTPNP
ncbi:DUF6973 domain-containing protein [Streptomyces sp. NPDC001617]